MGVENQRAVAAALTDAGMIVCAWGAHGGHLGQDQTMLGWIDTSNERNAPVLALGLTKDGYPRHPLYMPANRAPIAFDGYRKPSKS
ncbi:DUF1643 domain-containing protein, partial [Acinetobacter baumannii]